MNIIKKNGKVVDAFPNIEGSMTIKDSIFEDCAGVEDLFGFALRLSAPTARNEGWHT